MIPPPVRSYTARYGGLTIVDGMWYNRPNMERYVMKHINGWERFRVVRPGVCLACLICCALITLPLSYADTIWLRNGKSYSDVTIIEETETELVLEFRGGRTHTVLKSTVVGHIVDTKAKTGIEPGGRSIKLRSQSPQARPRSQPFTRSGRRSLHAYRDNEGRTLFTNIPEKYDAQYEELLTQLEKARSQYRPNQTMNFFVDPQEGHDDFLISLALVAEAARDYSPRAARGGLRDD